MQLFFELFKTTNSVAGPYLWNLLPPHIKSSTTLGIFKCNLKTYLFSLAFNNPNYPAPFHIAAIFLCLFETLLLLF